MNLSTGLECGLDKGVLIVLDSKAASPTDQDTALDFVCFIILSWTVLQITDSCDQINTDVSWKCAGNCFFTFFFNRI